MKINVIFFGPLAAQAGEEKVLFELNQGAVYGDLLDEIHRRFGQNFHERIWDVESKKFKAGILIVGEGRDLDLKDTPLIENEEIKIIPVSAGG